MYYLQWWWPRCSLHCREEIKKFICQSSMMYLFLLISELTSSDSLFFSSDFCNLCFLTAIAVEKLLKSVSLLTKVLLRWPGSCKWNPNGKYFLQFQYNCVSPLINNIIYNFYPPPQHMTPGQHRLYESGATNFQMPLEKQGWSCWLPAKYLTFWKKKCLCIFNKTSGVCGCNYFMCWIGL